MYFDPIESNKTVLLSVQDSKVLADILEKSPHSLESRTVTVCSGLDLVNITYTLLIARDPEVAKV